MAGACHALQKRTEQMPGAFSILALLSPEQPEPKVDFALCLETFAKHKHAVP